MSGNPILSVSFPKTRKQVPKNFRIEETESILDYEYENENASEILNIRDKAILEVLYSSGLRVFELVDATLVQLSADHTILKVLGKRRKERFV